MQKPHRDQQPPHRRTMMMINPGGHHGGSSSKSTLNIFKTIGSFIGVTQNLEMFEDIYESIKTGKNHMTTNDWITMGGDFVIIAASIFTAGTGTAAAGEGTAAAEAGVEDAVEDGGERVVSTEGSRLSGELHWRNTGGLEDEEERVLSSKIEPVAKNEERAISKTATTRPSVLQKFLKDPRGEITRYFRQWLENRRISKAMEAISDEKRELMEAIMRDDDQEKIEVLSRNLKSKLYRSIEKGRLPKGKGPALDALRAQWREGKEIVEGEKVFPRDTGVRSISQRLASLQKDGLNTYTRVSEKYIDFVKANKNVVVPLVASNMVSGFEKAIERSIHSPNAYDLTSLANEFASVPEDVDLLLTVAGI